MNTLIYKDGKATGCHIDTFPDGQRLVTVDLSYFDVKTPIHIKLRITRFDDIEIVCQFMKALLMNDRIIYQIDFIYMIGMRSDRIFTPGQINYFKDVILPSYHSISIKKAMFFPHNPNYILDKDKNPVIDHVVHWMDDYLNYPIRIAADESFYKPRPYLNGCFAKDRSNNEIHVFLDDSAKAICANHPNEPILIVDDLCDGGATFIAEAEYLKELYPNREINLFVAHGLFTKGLSIMFDYFNKIYTTNSYQDFDDTNSMFWKNEGRLIVKEVI